MIKTEDLLSVVVSGPRSIVLVTDEQYRIRYASLTVKTIFDIEPYSLLGKNALNLVPPNQREKWQQCLAESNNNGHQEISLPTRKGEERFFDVTVSNHMANDQIRGVVVCMLDITDRKSELKKLETANHHLDHFIFKTTHDLRAPINSALGLVNLAEKASEEDRTKYLGLIKSSLLRLESFIEEVNSFYKNEKLAILNEQVDIAELLKTEVETLENQPEAAGIHISVSVVEDAKSLYTDPIRLQTIITNILSNSIKYSDPQKENRFIRVVATVMPQVLQLEVEDNGVGIEAAHRDKIFDMFYRGHSQSKGTGLGLYIVKDTIDRLGGVIHLRSQPGQGTTFYVQVPNKIPEPVLN